MSVRGSSTSLICLRLALSKEEKTEKEREKKKNKCDSLLLLSFVAEMGFSPSANPTWRTPSCNVSDTLQDTSLGWWQAAWCQDAVLHLYTCGVGAKKKKKRGHAESKSKPWAILFNRHPCCVKRRKSRQRGSTLPNRGGTWGVLGLTEWAS